MSRVRPVVCVLLPFAAGYYLSYLFRSINALIATDLTPELGLSAADLGLLTSVYFLVFAAVVLRCGVLLDRYGPRLIDSALLLLAAAGSLLFAVADGVATLLVGRALIGLGVAVGLMAGLKAIVLWFPPERVALANGFYIMLGAFGALSATGPAEVVVQASAGAGSSPLSPSPQRPWRCSSYSSCLKPAHPAAASPRIGFLAIYLDPRFLRIAPLAALGVGHVLLAAGLVGGTVAHGRCGTRPLRRRRTPHPDDDRTRCERPAVGSSRRAATPRRHPDRAVLGRYAGPVDDRPARLAPRSAGLLLSALLDRRRRRGHHRVELRGLGAVLPKGGLRSRQRRPRRPKHGHRFRPALPLRLHGPRCRQGARFRSSAVAHRSAGLRVMDIPS